MESASQTRIVDITEEGGYERYLHRCLAGPPSRGNKRRIEYLSGAIPNGFHKKLVIFDEDIVGQIEYSPSEVSYYPIHGDDVLVMNCIWVLRRAKGHDFGKLLIANMTKSERAASCFATIGLENHWSPWFRKWQMEKLGFRSLESVNVEHRTKCEGRTFSIHLMWMPAAENANLPTWDQRKLLEGITSCIAHPLYHPQSYKPREIFEKC
ncbi:hypothetical protein GWN49_00585 [Candidatus Bathyarchaeota archaeon]|nr:hypothetical protein [Candidatus Bathyarchaeota archaeon]